MLLDSVTGGIEPPKPSSVASNDSPQQIALKWNDACIIMWDIMGTCVLPYVDTGEHYMQWLHRQSTLCVQVFYIVKKNYTALQ